MVKPTVQELAPLCPDLPLSRAEQHLARLGDDYFEAFSTGEVAKHLAGRR